MSEPIIELKSLSRCFGKLMAVDAISFSVQEREVFGLLGSNGAGKTTTIKMLTTLLPPTSGDAMIAGLSITTNSVGVRRAIGYVPQAVSIDNMQHTIIDNIIGYFYKSFVIAEFELRKLRHDFTELITRALPPRCGC